MKNVLIVNSDPQANEYLDMLLRERGLEVETANSMALAKHKVEIEAQNSEIRKQNNFGYALIFIGETLLDCDGHAFADWLRLRVPTACILGIGVVTGTKANIRAAFLAEDVKEILQRPDVSSYLS